GQTAVIEQPAFETMTIKGRVLDPNNEAVRRTHIIALPLTSHGARADKEGYFELPWSPAWIDKGQAVYILAKGGYPRHEAAFVEVADPTQPVAIRLEPAAKLVGRMADPEGRQIVEYTVHLSLPAKFKCQAPVLIARIGYAGAEHIFRTIPFGTNYRLTITSEGYQTKQLTVNATDRSRDVIDIGTITLQPQDATESVVAGLAPNPELAGEFHDIYRLDEREVIKVVKPPFVLGRQEFLLDGPPGFQNMALRDSHVWHVRFVWDGKVKLGGSAIGMSRRLDLVMRIMLNMPYHDYNVSRELNVNMPQGDWIVRANLPIAEQLKALEEIIHAETNRAIRFEKRAVERDVIIARGRYEFKPHPSGNYPDCIHLTFDGVLDRGGGSSGSLAQLFSHIEFETRVEIVDETEPMEKTSVRYRMGDIREISRDPELRGERLRALADNLARTTSLQIEVERRPAEMWFATEAVDD
ncbi:MAG: carboxypeptidase-like regulatory domain-containing protein, partial [Planctomycetota bacterium]